MSEEPQVKNLRARRLAAFFVLVVLMTLAVAMAVAFVSFMLAVR